MKTTLKQAKARLAAQSKTEVSLRLERHVVDFLKRVAVLADTSVSVVACVLLCTVIARESQKGKLP